MKLVCTSILVYACVCVCVCMCWPYVLICIMYYVNCSSNGNKSGSNSQPLVQWMEVVNHPGLIYCMTQTSNNPIVIMVKPDCFLIQEVKIQPAKAKVKIHTCIH